MHLNVVIIAYTIHVRTVLCTMYVTLVGEIPGEAPQCSACVDYNCVSPRPVFSTHASRRGWKGSILLSLQELS